ncbi:hypothetical protein AJ80_03046 [Polytolypa hystricis UAMH7299]|uniref:Uncharacterized protein n=1 Tax=Polytolypa hystricis (strain UAMH7299) TaxID=1447883 RepID=A0A2B7YKS0_POLH7|nr:hypothetical protein AJ80_03046 [Polytolypa hystricis UAMH7299]
MEYQHLTPADNLNPYSSNPPSGEKLPRWVSQEYNHNNGQHSTEIHYGGNPDEYQRVEPTQSPRYATEKSTDTLKDQIPRQYEVFGRPSSGCMFIIHWLCMILTVAATVLFGIWAPLSYSATKEGNQNNDAQQSYMAERASSANDIASSALSLQRRMVSEQARALVTMQAQLEAMGQVALLQACAMYTGVSECSSFIASLPISSLFAQITDPGIPSTITDDNDFYTTSSARPTQPPMDGDSSSGGASGGAHLPLAGILGIVFGGIIVVGISIGVAVWRLQQRGRRLPSK